MKHYTVDKYNDNNDNNNLHYLMNYLLENRHLAPVVEALDSPIQWINHYSKDKFYRNQLCYPMDKDLSSGLCNPPFEQLRPDESLSTG